MQTKDLMSIYYALFNSIVSYGILAWGGSYKNSIRQLVNLQSRILRIIHKNNFELLNYPLNINQLFLYESLIYHFSDLQNVYREQKINTRNKSLQIPKTSKKDSEKNSYIVAIKQFNLLPNELKILVCNKQTIKNKLKNWIKSSPNII